MDIVSLDADRVITLFTNGLVELTYALDDVPAARLKVPTATVAGYMKPRPSIVRVRLEVFWTAQTVVVAVTIVEDT